MEGLRIYFRQRQLQDIDNGNANVIIDCGSAATYIPGIVPKPDWVEMTDDTDGLSKLQLSWDAVNQGASGTANQIGSNYDKGISLDLTFSGEAFNYIEEWLLTTQCQILNSIEVRIDDVLCGKSFRLFEIKADNLKYTEDDKCRIDVKLREADPVWHCIHKTFIWDDHQKWFNQDGLSNKDHPTFLTCIEPRPRIMNSVRLGFLTFLMGFPSGVQEIIIAWTNYDHLPEGRRILDINNFVPAPLIRTYIDNVAAKCGLSVDTIFHRPGTPEYMACLFHPLAGGMYQNDDSTENSPSTKFIFENRWNVTLAELFDKLKVLYNAEWYVTPNNTVVFKSVYELQNLSPIYDFTTGSLKLTNIEYTFSGTKKAAYGRYQYQPDGSDLGSQEVSNLYNDIVDYDGPLNNPMLEGEKSKSFEFAPTAFVRDGRSEDYMRALIEDAKKVAIALLGILAVVLMYLLAGIATWIAAGVAAAVTVAWIAQINYYRNSFMEHFASEGTNYTGAVRLVTGNQTMTPRVIIWDGVSMQRAKASRTNNPAANTYYNPGSTPYIDNNSIGANNPAGNIFNYQMYFDSKYQNNMFDRFHDLVDNPLKSLETNQSFQCITELCCETMNLLGLWEADFIKIGYVIKIAKRTNYDIYGRIEHIDVNYDNYTIRIKGKVIKR